MKNINDLKVVRELAKQIAELAAHPEMAVRKRQWRAIKDLKAERPMIMVETYFIEGFVPDSELQCREDFFRAVEWSMKMAIRHALEVGDDVVIEPWWNVWWDVDYGDYGIPIDVQHSAEPSVAYRFDHPVKQPEDLDRLQKRSFSVNRESTLKKKAMLEEAFGDILPVISPGINGYNAALTHDLFRLIGNDRLMLWMFDEPEALHRAMSFLCEDRLSMLDFLERENLLGLNNFCTVVGSGSYGCTSALPQDDYRGAARTKDLWAWCESQETSFVSPSQFAEFFLPYIARVAERFGLVYYGCCEQVHDRWEYLRKAIPNIRAVSVSPWSDMKKVAEMIGKSVVFSRKPMPGPLSGPNADWDTLGKDLNDTVQAARDCNLEIIFRDIYDINGDVSRLRKWVDMARSQF